MKAIIADLTNKSESDTNPFSASVSFRKFIDFVKTSAQTETSIRRAYLEKAVNLMSSQPGFSDIISIEDTSKYLELLRIVYDLLTPSLQQGENIVWAIGIPLSPVLFYGTDRFYEMVMDLQTGELRGELMPEEPGDFSDRDLLLPVHQLVMQHLYGIKTPEHKPMVIRILDKKTGIPQYFHVDVDQRFIDVYPAKQLPKIDSNAIQKLLTGNPDIGSLLKLLPLSHFSFEGISIITLVDVTTEFTLEHIKTIILEKHNWDKNTFYKQITDSLRILIADPRIDFGLVPLIRINGRLIFDKETIFHSMSVPMDLPEKSIFDTYHHFANHFTRNQDKIFLPDIEADSRYTEFVKALKSAGIQTYAMIPVYNDLQIIGLLEVYTTADIMFDETYLSKTHPANNLISRIFQDIIDDFNLSIETVIKEKFTSVQQAVRWKFEETAWHFLRDNTVDQVTSIEKIVFKNVYPLYGAIDIRNSTKARNEALRQDLLLQFDLLIRTLTYLGQKLNLFLAQEMSFKCKKFLIEISDSSAHLDEMRINEFLDAEAHPFLRHFSNNYHENKKSYQHDNKTQPVSEIDEIRLSMLGYYESIDPATGSVYASRRELERSMQMINSAVNTALDEFKSQVQPLYPAYFEKFRTDGIEYDIYIGQSIEPEKKFSLIYYKNIKLWQLSSMASIIRITNGLIPQMQTKLQTTQLIFVNSDTIDISFRDDERRFDVEGAYNIRYHVIKKRIDKVRVKETGERLTQPGKIALVYFQNKSISDYLDYIRFLQAQDVLSNDLEFLELEDLQDVSGLRALRVGVVTGDIACDASGLQ